MEPGGRFKEMGMLSSFSYNSKLNTEPRTLDDHHTEPNPQHQIDNPGQDPDPVPQRPTEDGPPIRYRECLKNHAANMGGYVVDGCGEFMPSGEDGAGEVLKCAACECHRNFHRKESTAVLSPTTTKQHEETNTSSEDLNVFAGGRDSSHLQPPMKRFRTKFSEDQKDKMREFADKLGWRIQKQDEPEVQQFCGEVGVQRRVFKVWMHNSKQAMKRKQM
ncbi:hypothetical protein F3Y22_tig00112523pilonHSYRG00073 [Hibiscus syriacus]|uniref:ZF-HD dimerization-type domain-containing protein n=1 Tax=Hibiscus syriacus TaxID=106335 RepID=A0A6A2X9G9_HIBSY|nr:hypothetical protein F3Y22_tig00112523pilonHSYRG00073 [Hibiscus syriacus]